MKKLLFIFTTAGILSNTFAQCITTNITGNYIQSTDIILSGIINVTGTYTLPAGVTITVPSYGLDNCGSLTINANKIIIQGNIIADYSGYPGGNGGLGATLVNSITGHENGLTGCVDKDNPGQITVGGGQAGQPGTGIGAGLAGGNGTVGSGTKQQCQTSGDDAGLIGGSGGAGGGGGGSYGGTGTSGPYGGAGASTATIGGIGFSSAYTPIAGFGGIGGNTGITYGTIDGTDIDLGSGGGGSGGGGRSFYVGENGLPGGDGGGMVKLIATDSLIVTGNISAVGENGQTGGKGGNGDKTADCCNDVCNDCGERSFTVGAGGGSGSGAGSGGGILLQSSDYMYLTGTLSVNGGNGGGGGLKGNGVSCLYDNVVCGTQNIDTDNGNDGSIGASGGGGRIKIFTTNCPTNIVTPIHTEVGGSGAANGTYAVVVAGCPAFVNTENYEGTLLANIYPNPAKDYVFIQMSAFNIGMHNVNILVYDVTGKLIKQEKKDLIPGAIFQLSTENMASGIYSIVLRNNNAHNVYKFIKQ